jgi:hypothetical protein
VLHLLRLDVGRLVRQEQVMAAVRKIGRRIRWVEMDEKTGSVGNYERWEFEVSNILRDLEVILEKETLPLPVIQSDIYRESFPSHVSG